MVALMLPVVLGAWVSVSRALHQEIPEPGVQLWRNSGASGDSDDTGLSKITRSSGVSDTYDLAVLSEGEIWRDCYRACPAHGGADGGVRVYWRFQRFQLQPSIRNSERSGERSEFGDRGHTSVTVKNHPISSALDK